MGSRLRHLGLVARLLPALLVDPGQRRQLTALRQLCRRLPQALAAPLPQALAGLEPPCPPTRPSPRAERRLLRLADAAALLERRSPLGLCLRRSLVRFHALRAAGLPVAVCFGARHRTDRHRAIAGHAWLLLDGAPYHEPRSSWQDWTVMLVHPPDAGRRPG